MPFPKVSVLARDCILYTVNPVSPKSDKHQLFSPKNINTQSREKVVRINEIITLEEKML